MSRVIVIRPEAEADLDDAHLWYERQRKGLGADFLLCFDEALQKVQRNPDIYPTVHRSLRRGLIRRFPYGVFYLFDETQIIVVGVIHARRDPKRWQERA